jgi:CheY-like chemotaxis protein
MNMQGLRILLVEDEPSLQFVFKKQLQRLGFELTDIVDNGAVAVERASEHNFKVIFMDVRLPGMDGISATKQIRANESKTNHQSKIVGLTAFGERQRCIDAGMDDFLQKPILLAQLKEVIDKWAIENPKFRPQSEAAAANLAPAVTPEQFKETEVNLKRINKKIADLRKTMGLD